MSHLLFLAMDYRYGNGYKYYHKNPKIRCCVFLTSNAINSSSSGSGSGIGTGSGSVSVSGSSNSIQVIILLLFFIYRHRWLY